MILDKPSYHTPDCILTQSVTDSILCTSPGLGENEGIDYEDLVI